MKAGLAAVGLAVCLCACGGKSSSTPSAPSPVATPTRIIGLSGNLDFGDIQVGSSATATLRITNSGSATLTITGMTITAGLGDVYTSSFTNGTIPAGAVQEATIRFVPAAEQPYNRTLAVNGDQTSGTNTVSISGRGARPPGPRTTFGSGQYLVGSDVAPGRYYTNPVSGCYWERQSGLGGSLDDVLANDFVGFDAAQLIVDILSSDLAFETDGECGTWFNSPRHGAQTSIVPGAWLVGAQVPAGRYRANVSAGCYWERLRNFTGSTSSGVIANDFVGSAGQQIVDVRSSDVGFYSDEDCGTWTRVTTLTSSTEDVERPISSSEIESNRQMYRRKNSAGFQGRHNRWRAPSLVLFPIGDLH